MTPPLRWPLLPLAILFAAGSIPAAAQRPAQRPADRPAQGRPQPPLAWDVTADGVADLSPDDPTRPDSARFALRGIELDLFQPLRSPRVTLHGTVTAFEGGRVAVDEARVDWRGRHLVAGAGRFVLPLGRETVHRHDYALIERPMATQRFIAPEVASGTGVRAGGSLRGVSLTAAMVDHIVDPVAGRNTIERANRLFSSMGYVARLDARGRLGRLGAIELVASGATSRIAQPLSASAPQGTRRVNAVLARQGVATAALTFTRGRLQLTAEGLGQFNEDETTVARRIPADLVNGGPFYRGPTGTFWGSHVTAGYRLTRGALVLLRGETLQDPDLTGRERRAITAGTEWRLLPGTLVARGAYQYRTLQGDGEHRILLEGVAMLRGHRSRGM